MHIPASMTAIENRVRAIESQLKQFSEPASTTFAERLDDAQAPDNGLMNLIESAASTNGLDPDLAKAVAQVESGFNPDARSEAGALGLMQLMPKTAASLGVSNALDPAQNALGGTKYLKSLLTRYHGEVEKSLAAYNAGPTAVDKAHGVPPFAETKAYVSKVMKAYRAFQSD